MPNISKELAEKIAKKLKAKKRTGTAHDLALIYHKGKLVANFGIRRGSRKDAGHDYIPAAIFLGARDARLLGECTLSRDDWITVMAEKGKL